MSRPRKPARLWLRPARKDCPALWIILDGPRQISTGCSEAQVNEAHQRLAEHVLEKAASPERKINSIDNIYISDVLTIYTEDVALKGLCYKQKLKMISRLNDWWGEKTLGEVTRKACRDYQTHRGNRGGTRHDLQILAAAINHHHKEGLHREAVLVSLPPKGESRKDWLERSEIAKLLRTAWRAHEKQSETKKTMRHLARFILMAYYTASRPGVVYTASWTSKPGHSYIDLDNGIFYRRRDGAAKTNKRQPPVRLPPQLLAHLRRWKEKGICHSHPVEWHGEPVQSVKVAFASLLEKAKIGAKLSPYVFRHTAITHMLQAGVSTWETAGFAGTSEKMIEDHYGHHSPHHMANAVGSFSSNKTPKIGVKKTRTNVND